MFAAVRFTLADKRLDGKAFGFDHLVLPLEFLYFDHLEFEHVRLS